MGAAPAAGWYEDPRDASGYRWWNGATWSDHTAPGVAVAAVAAVDGPVYGVTDQGLQRTGLYRWALAVAAVVLAVGLAWYGIDRAGSTDDFSTLDTTARGAAVQKAAADTITPGRRALLQTSPLAVDRYTARVRSQLRIPTAAAASQQRMTTSMRALRRASVPAGLRAPHAALLAAVTRAAAIADTDSAVPDGTVRPEARRRAAIVARALRTWSTSSIRVRSAARRIALTRSAALWWRVPMRTA